MKHYESSDKRKSIAPKANMRKMEKDHISDLTAHLKALEQKEADSSKRRRRQYIINLKAKINTIKTKKCKESMKQRAGSLIKSTR